MDKPTPKFDAVYYDRNGQVDVVPLSTVIGNDPLALAYVRANRMRSLLRLDRLKRLTCGPGMFNFGEQANLELPVDVEIDSAYGNKFTIFKSGFHDRDNAQDGGAWGACFKLTTQNVFRGIHFQGPGYGPPGQEYWQQTVVGWIGDKTPGTHAQPSYSVARFQDCLISDGTFGLSIWAGYGNLVKWIGGGIESGRWAVTAGCSGGHDACYIYAALAQFDVDASLSKHGGNQGYRALAAALRGGSSQFNDCSFNVRGNDSMELAAAIWTPTTDTTKGDREAGSPYTQVAIVRSDLNVNAGGAQHWAHIEAGSGLVRVDKRTKGLGPGTESGNLVVRGNVEVGL